MVPEALVTSLESWCRRAAVPGASAAVRRRGTPDAVGAWGVDAREPDRPMPTTGRFRIGSITKTFTSALVLDRADRGELSLDATIERWLPGYPNASRISIRSLLDHTAGTADMIFDGFAEYSELLLADLERPYRADELVELMATLPPHDAPGATYRYSNTDYNLLGLILEHESGTSFADLIEQVAAPLALHDTSYDAGVPDDLLHGWFDLSSDGEPRPSLERNLDVREFPNTALITLAYAAGGMTSSLRDLLMWTESLYAGDVLSPAMRAQLLASPHVVDPSGGHHGFGVFGYGDQRADGSWPAYGHAGNIIGSSAFVAWFPASATTVAFHANVLEVPSARLLELAGALEAIGAHGG